MWKKFKTRIRNRRVIAAIASGILIILVNTGIIGEDLSAKVTEMINGFLTIGVTLGIFSNPESHMKE